MDKKYFSLGAYRRDFPSLSEEHYDTIAKLIADHGHFSLETSPLTNISEIMEKDLPADRPITERTREINMGKSRDVRVAGGRMYTSEEMKERRQKTMRLP